MGEAALWPSLRYRLVVMRSKNLGPVSIVSLPSGRTFLFTYPEGSSPRIAAYSGRLSSVFERMKYFTQLSSRIFRNSHSW